MSNSFWGIPFTRSTSYTWIKCTSLYSEGCQTPFEGSDKLYINKVYLFLRDVKLLLRNSIYKLLINAVYFLLRDAKLLLRDSIYKLYLKYSVPPLLRDVKLLLRDSVYKLKINTSFWGIPYDSKSEVLLPYTLSVKRFLVFKRQKSLK